MSDELAYFELSHMGNPYIKTPNIDRFAKEGIRFTSALAGAPVCAPLRCNLMTGKHAGHASVRANGGGTPLRAGEPTIASMLKDSGYATGGFGKWGCGGRDSTGVPEQHGFWRVFLSGLQGRSVNAMARRRMNLGGTRRPRAQRVDVFGG